MAESEEPKQAPEDEWLAERTKQTRTMAAAAKRQLANELQAGVAEHAAGELLAIDRLEAKLANRERIERVRRLTRTRG